MLSAKLQEVLGRSARTVRSQYVLSLQQSIGDGDFLKLQAVQGIGYGVMQCKALSCLSPQPQTKGGGEASVLLACCGSLLDKDDDCKTPALYP